jgi:DNA-binding transcriptional ArsR family regulator
MEGEVKGIVLAYFRIVELALRFGRLSVADFLPDVSGDERYVVEALLRLGEANITRIAEEVRVERGHASRNTVRKHLAHLEGRGIVVRDGNGLYRLSDDVVLRWFRVLGIGGRQGKK